MKTLRLKADAHGAGSEFSTSDLHQAASILRNGGLVAFPTETVYGLGANALLSTSVAKIFLAKQRPAWDPLIVHISDLAMLPAVVSQGQLNPSAQLLIQAFWPGPLTLLLPKADAIPGIVTANRPLVGVRMPAHPVAHALIAAAGVPIAAPSANRFGHISPTTAAHVLEDLDERIDAVLDAGETTHGLESTVVDASQEPVIVYRPGVISIQTIREVCGSAIQWAPVEKSSDEKDTPPESMPSPGVSLRHYAPRAQLLLIDSEIEEPGPAVRNLIEEAIQEPRRAGVMLPSGLLPQIEDNLKEKVLIFDWGNWRDLAQLAHRLFAGLRALDSAGVEVILCPLPSREGIGAAIRDRLLKAAQGR